MARVSLRPLLQDIPFFGGASVSLLRPPEFDFDLGGSVGSVLDLPGIGFLLRRVVSEQMQKRLIFPKAVSVSFLPSPSSSDKISSCPSDSLGARAAAPPGGATPPPSPFSVRMPSGVLSVHLVEAKNLMSKDIKLLGRGKSDPYVKLTVVADGASHTFR